MSDPENPLIVSKRPALYFHYDLSLVSKACWAWKKSDYRHIPSPDEMAGIDMDWLEDLSTYDEWIRFHSDSYK